MTRMQCKISPAAFDVKFPIVSRSNTSINTSFSFRNIINSTASHLVAGYVANKNLQVAKEALIPNDVKQLCFDYFIGKFPYSIHDDKLSELNDKAKNEFIQISLHLLCVGNDIYYTRLLLSHLINLVQCYEGESTKHLKRIYHSQKCYLSLLLSLTEIVDFYSVFSRTYAFQCSVPDASYVNYSQEQRTIYLKVSELTSQKEILDQQYKKYGNIESINIIGAANVTHKFAFITFASIQAIRRYHIDSQISQPKESINIDYNTLVMKLACQINDSISIELIYRLIQNINFYKLYANTRSKKLSSYSEFQQKLSSYSSAEISIYISFIQQHQLDILGLRRLLIPVVFQHESVDISPDPSSFVIQRLIPNKNANTKKVWLSWLWLQKEVEDIVLHAKDKIDLCQTLLTNVLTNVSSTFGDSDYDNINENNIKRVRFEVLYLLSEVAIAKINIAYKINSNFEYLQNLITNLLRSDKCGIIGWKILNMEIDKMSGSGGGRYQYFDNWKYFIEAKTGLFKMNIVSNVNILKEEKEENVIISNAQNQLQLSTVVCFKIHKLSKTGGLGKFDALFARMEKTKLIKPILAQLTI